MGNRAVRIRRQTSERNRRADDWSLSTTDPAHDGERAGGQGGSRVREVAVRSREDVSTAPASASSAGHTLARVPIMPQAESAAGPAGGPLSPETAERIEAARGDGTALDTGTRDVMESAFGTSFAGVRIHANGEADALNSTVGARAFTTGSDIFFRQGAFDPTAGAGRQLLAHELTHVVQQQVGASGSGTLTVGPAEDSYEQEADKIAALLDTDLSTGNSAVSKTLRSPAQPLKRQIQRQAPDSQPTGQTQPATQPVAQAEWNAHPAIKKRYATWQAYQAVRTRVASWTKPHVGDPASYIEAAIGEWNDNAAIHSPFDHNFDGNPHRSYLNLKRLYQERGIANPASYLATNIVKITFYNRTTQGHRDLQTALNTAETAMTAKHQTFKLDKGTWSFVPRTFNNNVNRLSNHALGKAIDINPQSNPHITSAADRRVIDAVCSTILPSGLSKAHDYDTLRQASDFFKQNFNHAWVAEQEQLLKAMQSQIPHPPGIAAQKALVTAIHHRHQQLNAYAAKGFLSLPGDLVEGLKSAGLGWGGEWHTSKDFMHFELQNP